MRRGPLLALAAAAVIGAPRPAPAEATPPSADARLRVTALLEAQAAPWADATPDVDAAAALAGDDRRAAARLRRAYVGVQGRLPFALAYEVRFAAWDGAALDDGRLRPAHPRLLDTWLGLRPGPWLVVAGGELPVALTRARLAPEFDQPLGERPRFVDRLTPDRRLGAAVWGDLGMLQYRAGVHRAAPTWGDAGYPWAFDDTTRDWPWAGVLVSGRVAVEPLGPLTAPPGNPWRDRVRVGAGVGAIYGRGAGRTRLGGAADLVLAWRALRLEAEALLVRTSAGDAARRSVGWYVAARYRLGRRLELAARHEWSDGNTRDDPFAADLPREWATALGLAVFLAHDRARVGATYVHREATQPSGPAGTADSLLLDLRARW